MASVTGRLRGVRRGRRQGARVCLQIQGGMEQETNECAITMQGLNGDPGGQKRLFENRRRRTNEKQGKINGITVPKKALRTTLDFNNRYSTLVVVVNGTEARKPGNITRTPTCRRHKNCRTSSGTSTCCRWRGRNGGDAGRRTSAEGNLKRTREET